MFNSTENIAYMIVLLGYINTKEVIDNMKRRGLVKEDQKDIMVIDVQNFLTTQLLNKHFKDIL